MVREGRHIEFENIAPEAGLLESFEVRLTLYCTGLTIILLIASLVKFLLLKWFSLYSRTTLNISTATSPYASAL